MMSFSVNGRLVYPLRSPQFKSATTEELPTLNTTMEETWLVTEKDLQEIEQHLLQLVNKEEEVRLRIPLFGSVREGCFPYQAVDGGFFFVVLNYFPPISSLLMAGGITFIDHSTTSIAPPPSNSAVYPCTICHRQIGGPDRQNHMGGHILRRLRGVAEDFDGNTLGSVSLFLYFNDS